MSSCAVVLGGYLNGYSIIKELHECGVNNIALIQYGKQLGGYSNKLKQVFSISKEISEFKIALFELKKEYDFLVLFPSDDLQIEFMKELEEDIKSFCYLPFNSSNVRDCSDKYYQYEFCEKLGVPYPKTFQMSDISDLSKVKDLMFPLLIKPNTRKDITIKVFRSLRIENELVLSENKDYLEAFLQQGLTFLVSEIIPGDTNGKIFAYTAFRNKSGKILNSWIGKKLTQYPDDYGVFSSASNGSPEIIKSQGETLINGLNLFGIVEPEFKYDHRDDKYKLTEINLRSMMWHRVGNRSGVKLQYSQWLDAIGKETPKYVQNLDGKVHYSYFKHEIINLIRRKKYCKYFINNLFGAKKNYYGTFDVRDIKPFIFDSFYTTKAVLSSLLKTIKEGRF